MKILLPYHLLPTTYHLFSRQTPTGKEHTMKDENPSPTTYHLPPTTYFQISFLVLFWSGCIDANATNANHEIL
jgi:hypothetical protein